MYQIAHARGPLYMMWGFFPLFFFNSGTMYITLHLRVLQSKPSLRQLTWTGVTLPSMDCSRILASVRFSSVALLSRIRLFATPWTAACQASLSITKSWSLHKLMSIESVMPSNHLILCWPLLLLPSIFPSIRVIFNGLVSSQQVGKVWELQLQHLSFQGIFRVDFL